MSLANAANTMKPAAVPLVVGSVDLGSNSFHMIVARFEDQHLSILDRLREPVCLAAGLDEDDVLGEEAMQRAIECLQRFGQRLRDIHAERVRAVGTNTLRRAANTVEVRRRLEQALGRRIDVITGQEEARLIYLGVAHNDFSPERRLVIDIGGGSTEVILGEGFEIVRAHSLYMGCVGSTREHFPDGVLTKERFRAAQIAAQLELRAIEAPLRAAGWSACRGASGTINAVQEILTLAGWSERGITLPALKKLRKALIRAGRIDALNLDGLRPDRAQVLPGGLAILIALFNSLEIETLTTSSGALREGLLHDLVGRIRHEDIRDRAVRRLMQRHRADEAQGARVESTAVELLRQVETGADAEAAAEVLGWAARLHEIGLGVSYPGYHKHGAYLVANADLAGFSADDQALVAALIRGHRRKIARSLFAHLPGELTETALRLCVLLRLAVVLNRGRGKSQAPRIEVAPDWAEIRLRVPHGWSRHHPLTLADLDQEAGFLRSVGLRLAVKEPATARAKR